MVRPRLRQIDLARAIPFRRGFAYATMSVGQWDTVLQGAYDAGFILLELDDAEQPRRAFLTTSVNAPAMPSDN